MPHHAGTTPDKGHLPLTPISTAPLLRLNLTVEDTT